VSELGPAAGAVPPRPAVTGADLVRFRKARKLSQRELAALMGVGHGMVAKAELVPSKALGEGMAAAFTSVALPSSATE
jgi:DNA-binding transcriptional regulator YiaG